MDEKEAREAIEYFKIMLFDMEGMGFKHIVDQHIIICHFQKNK